MAEERRQDRRERRLGGSYAGLERRTGRGRREEDRSIHPWRWRALTLWIIIFTIAVGYSIRDNRGLIKSNRNLIKTTRDQAASVHALQQTNCGLAKFLLIARKARWQTYKRSHRGLDIQAVVGYEKLVEPFLNDKHSVDSCPIPKRVLIPERPLAKIGS